MAPLVPLLQSTGQQTLSTRDAFSHTRLLVFMPSTWTIKQIVDAIGPSPLACMVPTGSITEVAHDLQMSTFRCQVQTGHLRQGP